MPVISVPVVTLKLLLLDSVAVSDFFLQQTWLTDVYKATLYFMHHFKCWVTSIVKATTINNFEIKANRLIWHDQLLLDELAPAFYAVLSSVRITISSEPLNQWQMCMCICYFFHLFVKQPFYSCTVMNWREIKIMLSPHIAIQLPL